MYKKLFSVTFAICLFPLGGIVLIAVCRDLLSKLSNLLFLAKGSRCFHCSLSIILPESS